MHLASCFAGARPPLFGDLSAACDRQGPSRNVPRDARPSADIRSVGNRYRRYKRRITTDKDTFANVCAVLVHAIVVAGDDTGANVRIGPNFGVAKIREMVCLRPLPNACILRLDEVAYVSSLTDIAPGAQMSVWADLCAEAGRYPR